MMWNSGDPISWEKFREAVQQGRKIEAIKMPLVPLPTWD
jgi:hypothetical protein